MTDLTPGKRYAVTLHGTADANGDLKVDGQGFYHLYRGAVLDDVVSIEQLPDPMPRWQIGDVIAWGEADVPDGPEMRHVAMRRNLTPLHSHSWWSEADAVADVVSDKRIAELWDAGLIELVARDGRPWPKDGAR